MNPDFAVRTRIYSHAHLILFVNRYSNARL